MGGMCTRVLQVIVFSCFIWLLAPSVIAHASGSWTSGEFSWGEQVVIEPTGVNEQQCFTRTVPVMGIGPAPENAKVCIFERPSFRYAIYHKSISNWWGGHYTQSYFLIGFGSDQNLYVVENMSTTSPLEVSGSDDLHYNTLSMGFTNNHLISYIVDFPSKLTRIVEFGSTARYQLINSIDEVSQPYIPYQGSNPVITGAVAVSPNGDWMVAEIMGAGLVRIDTSTRTLQGFSGYTHSYGYGSDAHMNFRMTSDGSKIAAFDYNISPTVYSLNDSCVTTAEQYDDGFVSALRGELCPTDGGRLYEALSQKFTNQYSLRAAAASEFNTDGDTLYFDNYVYEDEIDWTPTVYRTPLYAGGYVAEESIEYMALGDSFTSGEGDIEKKDDGASYYRSGTERVGQCHVSSRSYPFLLRDYKNISPARMQSVACSGAQILPDYIGNPHSYLGQGNRLKELSENELADSREAALEDFTPGHITQIEFVKKYQPKTITLMGGGNDVGFANILEYCASPSWEGVFVDGTCGYAIEGHALRAMLGQSIQSQYGYTLMLLRMIRQASPNTTVYIIGYPSFISESSSAICLNSAILDADERIMIHEGLTAMNAMLKAAAESAGVRFIDIQDTLRGGRLCEGSEYVTGLNDITYNLEDYGAEVFHPNAKAHAKIAEYIQANGFTVQASQNDAPLSEPVSIDAVTPFGDSEARTTLRQSIFSQSTIVEGLTVQVNFPAGLLAANSTAKLAAYSQPTELATITTANDGSLHGPVDLPDSLKPGRHIVILDGLSPSGEPLNYYEFITVVSAEPDDKDGDGLKDALDPCLFITSWIEETTGEDACVVKEGIGEGGSQPDTTPPPETSSSNPLIGGRNEDNTSQSNKKQDTPYVSRQSVAASATIGNQEGGKEASNLKQEKGEVQGVSVRKGANSQPTRSEVKWLVVAGIIGLSTLFGGYGILKALRSRL